MTKNTRPSVLLDGEIYGLQPRGGVSRVASELLQGLAGRADLQVVLRLPPVLLQPPPVCPGVRVLRDWAVRPWRWREAINRLRLRTAGGVNRATIYHSLFHGFAPLSGMRSVVTVYDCIHEKHPEWFAEQETAFRKKASIAAADAVVAISQSTRDDLVAMGMAPADKIHVIPLGVNETFRQPPSDDRKARFLAAYGLRQPYWLYVGERGGYKNFATVLKTFCQKTAKPDGDLVLVGGKPSLDKQETALLADSHRSSRLHLLPPLPDEMLQVAYACASALVVPSLAEGFGMTVLEAMACGVPVTVSDIPVFREVAGDAAIYVDPGDEAGFGRAMVSVLDSSLRERCRKAGVERSRLFSWEHVVARHAELYHRLAEQQGMP